MTEAAKLSAAYIRNGFCIVKIPPRQKFPAHDGWNQPGGYFTDPDAAQAYFQKNPNDNIGVVLGPSRLCSLDIDHADHSRMLFSEFGVDIDDLAANNPTVVGNPARFRVMFAVPDGVDLARHSINWPDEGGATTKHTVFEFRAGLVQDVLPPSIHPDTGQPYTWRTTPKQAGGVKPLPDVLLAMWLNWDVFKPQAEQVCPWAPKQEAKHNKPRSRQVDTASGPSVIDTFNAQHSLPDLLGRYGYRKSGRRWLSPHSKTKLPGVILLDEQRCYIHHASDPLCSDHPVDCFDLWTQYEHGGDYRRSTKAAADMLGLSRQRFANDPYIQKPPVDFDMEAGEVYDRDPVFDYEDYASQYQEPYQQQPAAAASVNGVDTTHCAGWGIPIDLTSPLPDVSSTGKPLSTIENLEDICRRLGFIIRYNVISKEEEILIPRHQFSIDNKANASMAILLSWCARFRMPVGQVGDFVTMIADKNQYNPVATWILSRPWDGVDRLQQLYDTITIAGNEDPKKRHLKEIQIRRWLISAVAAVFEPAGVSAHGVLVLQGDQYLGKTRWFKQLVPEQLGVVQDGMILRPEDRDSVKQVCSYWLVELGELDATFRKSDIAALKAFLTRKSDTLRKAYARKESTFARRTVFFGSVNPKQFLHDTTGNRRYWTLECEAIDHSHNIDMQQLWAQVKTLHAAGDSHYLTPEEMAALNEHNEDFQVSDPIEDKLTTMLRWDDPVAAWNWSTATDALMAVGFDRPTVADCTRAAKILRDLNGKLTKRTGQARLLKIPGRRG